MINLARLLLLWVFVSTASFAQIPDGGFADPFGDTPQFLPVEEAFAFDYKQQNDALVITFDIADGYYLYKKQFKTATKNATVGPLSLPAGDEKEDEFFGLSEVYHQSLTFTIPIEQAAPDSTVKIRYQGCADAGFCYPATTKVVYLEAVGVANGAATKANADPADAAQSQQFSLAEQLARQDNLPMTLLLFLALGIGLAFTPCVFPMYPILSGIVLGQGKQRHSSSRTFWLSFVYVQGMAITYSVLGLVVASAGVQFQAALQSPLILGIFITLFVLLALAMFGAFNLELPSAWQNRLNAVSQRQKQGNMAGVFVMGALSGLIASPCTTAPLTGILLFIAQSGDVVLGFVSLYVLSLGMGIPLILFGLTGGKLLPKAGNWMNIVKVTFGFMMLAVAIIFIERLWNSPLSDGLWTLLGLAAFSYFSVMNQPSPPSFAKGVRTAVIFTGLFASALLGYHTWQNASGEHAASPVSNVTAAAPAGDAGHPPFLVVKSVQDLKQKVAAASAQGKSVMVDLYADWCVACKEFEKYTFVDKQVQSALANTVWMQIDLTDNTPANLAFQKEFKILGLPTILFFDTQGNELPKARVTGFMRPGPFAGHVSRMLEPSR